MIIDYDRFLLFGLTLVTFSAFDMIWFSQALKTYTSELRPFLQATGSSLNINYAAGFLVYILLAVTVYSYAIIPVYLMPRFYFSWINPALLGLCVYGVYELTNKTLFAQWTWKIVIIDIVWGMVLFTLTTHATLQLHGLLKGLLK